MESESLHWLRFAKCLVTLESELLRKLLKFIIQTCLCEYNTLWLDKADFHDQCNHLKVSWNTFDKPYRELDASSQQILHSLLAECKNTYWIAPMEIRIQLSVRKNWEDDVRDFNHGTHQYTLKKWSSEMQNLERLNTPLLTLINDWTQEFINICQADEFDLVRLTERHHERTNNSSVVVVNKLECWMRKWPGELHTVLTSFQQKEMNRDHELHIELQASSASGQSEIEKLLVQMITFILSSKCHILQTLVTTVRNILQAKHRTFQLGLTNTFNTCKMSEWHNQFQQVGAFISDTHNIDKTSQTAVQAFPLASNRHIRDCFYSERIDVLKSKLSRIIRNLQWSSIYQIYGYIDLGMFDKILLNIMHRNVFPICLLEIGWSSQMLGTDQSVETDLMRLKICWISYIGHIAAPTVIFNEFQNLCTLFTASLQRRSKAFCGEFKLNVNKKTAQLKSYPSNFCEDIEIKLKVINLNKYDILNLERSTDEKRNICRNHVQTIDEKAQKLHEHEIFKTQRCLMKVSQTYSTLLLERIRDAEHKSNSSSLYARMQWCGDFYLNHAEEDEQFDSAGFADNGRKIHAANTYVPNSKPAGTENGMVQMIDHYVLINGRSSKSNPLPIVVTPLLLAEEACFHTPVRVTDDPSDYISLTCEKRPANVSFRVKDNLLEHLSSVSKMTKEQDLVKFREKVKLHSSRKKSDICSLVKGFFTILGTIIYARSNGSKTLLYTLSELNVQISLPKEMFEARMNDRNVNDIDLQDKKKHYLQRLTRNPFESLPQPILNRDAIVCFVEGQTRDTFGGSSVSPFEHGELREMLNQLASDNVPGPQVTMKYEMLRLLTMKSFPEGNHPFAIRMAGAGFYYAGNRDQVVCYCCGSRKDNWVLGDIPLFIHKTMFPSCSFLTRNDTVNVPIIKTKFVRSSADIPLIGLQNSNGSNQLDTAQGESPLTLLSSEQQSENISSRNHQMLLTNKGSPTHQLMPSGGKNVFDCGQKSIAHILYSTEDPPPMYPQYSSKRMRINSFQGWPVELRHRPEEMAECGFYYAGFGDCVRCFCCGVGLRQWINEDDPWIEHARWSTSCIYVLRMKGEEFVSLVKMAVEIAEKDDASRNNSGVNLPNQDNTEKVPANTVKEDCHNSKSTNSTAPKHFTDSTAISSGAVGGILTTPISSPGNADMQKYFLTDAARSVLDMGYEPKLVLRAIERVLKKKGSVELTGQIIMEAVFEIEEDKGNIKLPQTNQSEQENRRNAKDSAAAERVKSGDLAINSDQIVRQHTELRDATLCKICLDKTMSVVFLPCGHLVTCPDCASVMRKCPVCRSLIKGTVKTLFS
ncbi:hypothetical protein CHS0354_018237 [Potamilus streckersoni]|uniref:RING-type domain-containing protein n=1 Tax=Potamilus streckersoni TaxID=2493646 RepID=A0AAE0SJM0_9BIVA|nr:hypothetical protein CHS0354_018237 [Potamilus streckersoni]